MSLSELLIIWERKEETKKMQKRWASVYKDHLSSAREGTNEITEDL